MAMKDSSGAQHGKKRLQEINPMDMDMVVSIFEAMWTLTYTTVLKYKNKYESDSTLSKQAAKSSGFT